MVSGRNVRLLLSVFFCVSALITIGCTAAYFTDADTAVNSFFVDKNMIEVSEEFEQPVKGEKTVKKPLVINTGNTTCYVRAMVVVSDSRAKEYFAIYANSTEGINTADWKEASDGWLYYSHAVKKDEKTTPVFTHIFLAEEIPDSLLGFTVDVIFESVQSKGYGSASEAFESLKEGGGYRAKD